MRAILTLIPTTRTVLTRQLEGSLAEFLGSLNHFAPGALTNAQIGIRPAAKTEPVEQIIVMLQGVDTTRIGGEQNLFATCSTLLGTQAELSLSTVNIPSQLSGIQGIVLGSSSSSESDGTSATPVNPTC